jgi:hypothetical protein
MTSLAIISTLIIHAHSILYQDTALQYEKKSIKNILLKIKIEIKPLPASDLKDSLYDNLTILGATIESIESKQQLDYIYDYSSESFKILKNEFNIGNKIKIAAALNKGLTLKLYSNHNRTTFITDFNFEINTRVKVIARIKNKSKLIGNYKISWARYFDQFSDSIILNRVYEGSTSDSSNPFELNIFLPDEITFKLENKRTKKVYKSNPISRTTFETESIIKIIFIPTVKQKTHLNKQ